MGGRRMTGARAGRRGSAGSGGHAAGPSSGPRHLPRACPARLRQPDRSAARRWRPRRYPGARQVGRSDHHRDQNLGRRFPQRPQMGPLSGFRRPALFRGAGRFSSPAHPRGMWPDRGRRVRRGNPARRRHDPAPAGAPPGGHAAFRADRRAPPAPRARSGWRARPPVSLTRRGQKSVRASPDGAETTGLAGSGGNGL